MSFLKSYVKLKVKQEYLKKWENSWLNKSLQQKLIKVEEGFNYRQTKLFLKSYRPDITHEIGELNRYQASQVIGLITGHCNVGYHLNNMDQSIPKECRLCGHHLEQASHLIFSCPVLRVKRAECFGTYLIDYDMAKTNWKVNSLVKFINETSLKDLLIYDKMGDSLS